MLFSLVCHMHQACRELSLLNSMSSAWLLIMVLNNWFCITIESKLIWLSLSRKGKWQWLQLGTKVLDRTVKEAETQKHLIHLPLELLCQFFIVKGEVDILGTTTKWHQGHGDLCFYSAVSILFKSQSLLADEVILPRARSSELFQGRYIKLCILPLILLWKINPVIFFSIQ